MYSKCKLIFRPEAMVVYLLIIFVSLSVSEGYAGEGIDTLLSVKKDLEYSNLVLSQQYDEVLNKIRRLKSKKNLSLFEEVELGRLLSKALSISNQIDANTDEVEKIKEKMDGLGYSINEDKPSTLRLRFLQDGLVDGPVELREKALLLKDQEERLQKEISILQESEKRMRLREEARAFIKEQSVFDEDSTLAVVKKNVKSAAAENASIGGNGSNDKIGSGDEVGYADSISSSESLTSTQDIRVKIEVSYEKSGILNQINSPARREVVIDIEPDRISADELRDKIEMLKRLSKDIADARQGLEQKAVELEKIFREKKR